MTQDTSKPRIVFMGTPDFAVPALQGLIDAQYPIAGVYCQPPRPKNRGHHVIKNPVHVLADHYNLPVYTPPNFKSSQDLEILKNLNPDVIIVAAYGLILPQSVLDIPPMGCLNIHGSLLPRWRGAAPIHRAMLAGDEVTGITLMRMDAGLDTGDMLATAKISLDIDHIFDEVHHTMSHLGADLLMQHLLDYCTDMINLTAQPDDGVTYAHKLKKDESLIDWDAPRDRIARQIKALNPWPSTHTFYKGVRLKIRAASRILDISSTLPPGTLIDDEAHVVCGDGGILSLDILQRDGGAPVKKGDFLRGFPLLPGSRLSSTPNT